MWMQLLSGSLYCITVLLLCCCIVNAFYEAFSYCVCVYVCLCVFEQIDKGQRLSYLLASSIHISLSLFVSRTIPENLKKSALVWIQEWG